MNKNANHGGMDEKTMLALCRFNIFSSARLVLTPYWTAEAYSFGKYIRRYGYYPQCLPLCIYTDHGAGRLNHPYEDELNTDAPASFYHSPDSVREWKLKSKKPCYVLYSPAVFYRRTHKIEKSVSSRGTLVFPAHTTVAIEDQCDMEEYIRQLLELPDRFQPVSACFHQHDIKKGQHKIFAKYKIPMYTAGHIGDSRFVQRFYDILRNFSYSTSNMIGSYTYYSVEMGIPFFIYGNKQIFINTLDYNITTGLFDLYRESESYRRAYDLFLGSRTEITLEQRNLVEKELGMKDGISRSKMARVLYFSFIKWLLSAAPLRYTGNLARALISFGRK